MAIVDKYISHITPLNSSDTYKLKAYLLKNGRTFKVQLDSTNASTAFDGSANITDIGVTGVLPIANGGTGANSRVNAYKALAYAGEFTGDIDATNNEAGIWSLGADNSYTGESLKTDLGITTLPNWSIFYQLPYVNTQLIFEGNPGQIYIRDREGSGSSLTWKTWKVLKQKPDNAGHADTAAALSPAGTTAQFWRGDNTWSNELSGGQLKITNYSNTVTIGSGNANYTHFNNSADIPFYFNKSIWVDGDLYPYGTSNTRSLGSSSKRWKSLLIGTADSYGDGEQPIYWNAGVPKATTYYLKASIESGTENRAAYYSGIRKIEDAGSIYMDASHIGVNGTNTTYQFYVNGITKLNGHTYVGAKAAYNDTNAGWYIGTDGTIWGTHASSGAKISLYGNNKTNWIRINPTTNTSDLTLGAVEDRFTMPKLQILTSVTTNPSNTTPTFSIGALTSLHLVINNNAIQARSETNNSTLSLNYFGGQVFIGQPSTPAATTIHGLLTLNRTDITYTAEDRGTLIPLIQMKYKNTGTGTYTKNILAAIETSEANATVDQASIFLGSSGGSLVLGAGESAATVQKNNNLNQDENIYLIADTGTRFYVNANTAANAKHEVTIDTNGLTIEQNYFRMRPYSATYNQAAADVLGSIFFNHDGQNYPADTFITGNAIRAAKFIVKHDHLVGVAPTAAKTVEGIKWTDNNNVLMSRIYSYKWKNNATHHGLYFNMQSAESTSTADLFSLHADDSLSDIYYVSISKRINTSLNISATAGYTADGTKGAGSTLYNNGILYLNSVVGNWAYTRLNNGTYLWDIATNSSNNTSSLQFRNNSSGSNATYVRFDLDGSIYTGNLIIGGKVDTDSGKTIVSSSTLYLKTSASASIIFNTNSTNRARFDTNGHFRPESTDTYTLGASSYLWSQVYAKSYSIEDTRDEDLTAATNDKAIRFFFSNNNMPTSAWYSGIHVRGWTGGYSSWELVGPSNNTDQRTTPLYLKTSNKNGAWGSWRAIATSNNTSAFTLNQGAANRAAYYSAAGTIEDAGSIYMNASHVTINGTAVPANSGNFQVIGTSTMRTILPEVNATYDLGTTDTLRWGSGFFTTSLRVGAINTNTGTTATTRSVYIGPDGFYANSVDVTSATQSNFVLRGKGKDYAKLYIEILGVADTAGRATLTLGNGTASTAADSAYGKLILYGHTTKYSSIESSADIKGHHLNYLPIYSETGTSSYYGRLVGIYKSTSSGSTSGFSDVGSTSQPVYVTANGVVKAITGAIANNTTGNAATATAANITSTDNAIVRFDGTAGKFQNSQAFVDDNGGIKGVSLGVAQTDGEAGYGLSLYGGPKTTKPEYGMMFAHTATYGTHGAVTNAWATYLTMSNTTDRGWIFQRGTTNVASISGYGILDLGVKDTSTERRVKVISGSGDIYLYAAAATTGLRGIYTHDTDNNGGYVIAVNQDNNISQLAKFAISPTPSATNTYSLGVSGTRWKAAFIGTADSYGSATNPIYWSNGVPVATNTFLTTELVHYCDQVATTPYYVTTSITVSTSANCWIYGTITGTNGTGSSAGMDVRFQVYWNKSTLSVAYYQDSTNAISAMTFYTDSSNKVYLSFACTRYSRARITVLTNNAVGNANYATAISTTAPATFSITKAATKIASTSAVKTALMPNNSTPHYVLGVTGTTADSNASIVKAYRTATAQVYFRGDTGVLMGAAWNDYAEYRQAKNDVEIEPGRVVKEVGDETLELTTERLQRGCSIVSNTFGISIGESETNKLPLAVAGRVLAYPYEDREEFKNHIGWPVCSGPNGTVSIMTEEEEMKYPSRIIGIISAIPDYEIWHGGADVIVDERIWIKVR